MSSSGCGSTILSIFHKFQVKNVRIAMLVLCIFSVGYGMAISYLGAVITTLEKRFNLKSADLGWLMGANDIGYLCFILPLSYIATRQDKSKILGLTGVGLGIACIMLASPYYLFGSKVSADELKHTDGIVPNKNLCLNASAAALHQNIETVFEAKHVKIVSFIIQMAGGILSGIATAPAFPVIIALLDDLMGKDSGFYIGILFSTRAFSPLLSFLFAGWSLRWHESLLTRSDQVPGGEMNPQWVGAWWLGWTVLGTLVFFVTPLVCMLKVSQKDSENANDKSQNDQNNTNKETHDGGDLDLNNLSVKELFEIIVSFLKNPVYLYLVIGLTFEIISLMTVFSFSTKFLTYYYRVSYSATSIMTGISMTGSGIMASLMGSLVSRFTNMSIRQMNFYHFWVNLISALLWSALFFFPCSPTTIVDLNIPFSNASLICRNSCGCGHVTAYNPVCYEGQTYFTPCEAGCSTRINQTTYGGCGCGEGIGVLGPCETTCSSVYGYLSAFFVIRVIGSMANVQFTNILLRQTTPKNKPIALALTGFIFGVLGWLLPPLGGALFDLVCLRRNIERNERSGYCLLYDNEKLRWVFNGFPLLLQFPACFFYFLSCYNTPNTPAEEKKTLTESHELEGNDLT